MHRTLHIRRRVFGHVQWSDHWAPRSSDHWPAGLIQNSLIIWWIYSSSSLLCVIFISSHVKLFFSFSDTVVLTETGIVYSSSVDSFQFRSQLNWFDDNGDLFFATYFFLAANNSMEKQCDREIDHVTDQSGLGHTGYLSIDRVPLPLSMFFDRRFHSFLATSRLVACVCSLTLPICFLSEERSKDTETDEIERWMRFPPFLKEEHSTRWRREVSLVSPIRI